ncbi:hypothetical protein [Laceyella tengchongensis]|uniref:hypothetical protein n=1 Tax=Laceyella tengchongensis TaxID=574699 RepID=UPI001670724A|nr:hypothetical protein [Laceyella tengchongensis]
MRYVDENPPPMYRITVDGQFVVDTAYESKITEAVSNAVRKQAKKIIVEQRDDQ